ncbi:ubiE/COQ5 methyltransferase family protein [Arthrobacter sp. ok909]|uniref:class I SAM-dependent methyltransferase n=1 Tax=Arthrobacter sp. ok909 TaxID=1761746 RepID=UPI00088515E1|nr:methyltransferase domain-containing protein [Arthrobacter sp. ok909]SDP47264.1 ubiE/COQ5 methyltransferase family protein [Arthrobacter sp. ok909]
MLASADRVRDEQRLLWDEFSAAWKKWDVELLDWHAPFGDALLEELRLRPSSWVLDVAAGTGEPALNVAGQVPDGRVVLADISAGMLRVAEEKALARGLRNVDFKVCDAAAMPFGDNTFDAVYCRFGLTFFPVMSAAMREMARTAKPGARVGAVVWGRAAENPWASLILGTIARHRELPIPPAGTPGLFRCAPTGFMTRMFTDAGLVDVTERKVSTDLVFESPESYWEFMTDIATTVAMGLAKADEKSRALIRSDVFALLGRYEHDGAIQLRSTATVVAGTKV